MLELLIVIFLNISEHCSRDIYLSPDFHEFKKNAY